MKQHPISIIAVSACVFLIAANWLAMITADSAGGNRGEYQSVIPFLIAGALAASGYSWVVKRKSGWRKITHLALVFALLLTPIPWGPEGTLMPLVFTLVFPPVIFLFLYPGRILLGFVGWFSLFTLLEYVSKLASLRKK